MRNVFLSFLGTSDYVPVHYMLREKRTPTPRKYIQVAINECLNSHPEQALVLATSEAKKKNGDGLCQEWNQASGCKLEFVEIPEGRTEDELWIIYNLVGSLLRSGDRLIVDFTHGFRSLPVMGILALGFFRQAYPIEIEGVYYGAFEAIDVDSPPGKALVPYLKEMPEAERCRHTAPIFDLTAMFELPRWAEAVSTWRKTGRAHGITEMAHAFSATYRRDEKNRGPQDLLELPNRIEMLDHALVLLRHDKIGICASSTIEKIGSARNNWKEFPRLAPLVTILNGIEQSVAALACKKNLCFYSDEYLLNQLNIVRWLSGHLRFMEAYSIFRELITSCAVRICVDAGLERNPKDDQTFSPESTNCRKQADDWLAAASGVVVDKSKQDIPPKVTQWVVEHAELSETFRKIQPKIRNVRNKLDHCWTGDHSTENFNKKSHAQIKAILDEAIDLMDRFLKGLAGEKSSHCDPGPAEKTGPSRFLNLSNHPLGRWPAEQLDAARALGLGEPEDLAGGMPEIPPDADTEAIEALARAVAQRALEQGAAGAFVASDFTFSFALVHELQERGVRCFASTTERRTEVESRADGNVERRSLIRFVRWREYPSLDC